MYSHHVLKFEDQVLPLQETADRIKWMTESWMTAEV